MATIKDHELVGEIAVLCDAASTVTSTSELVALQISKDLVCRLFNEIPEMAIGVMRDRARWLELKTRRLQQAVVQWQKLDDT